MSGKPRGIEHREKRFGIIATENGYITADELIDVLKVQVQEDMEYGSHRLIGEILLAQGKMTVGQIDHVLRLLSQR
ncbi:MAG: hypothetical protein ACFFCW_35235 [Candidatus Hodarchaeota archaeon]